MSTCNGEIAIGKGSRFPRVISISIKAKDLFINNKLQINKKNSFFMLTF